MKGRKAARTVVLALSLVTSTVATMPAGYANGHLGPVSTAIASVGTNLAQASMLADLVPAVPGFGTSPALMLGLHEAFGDLSNVAGQADLETALNTLGGADGFDYAFISDSVDGTVTTVEFTIAANRSFSMPLMVMEDDAQIIGSDVTATISMAPTTVTIEYDSSDGSFALTDLPTFSLNASLDETVTVPVQVGFADATASGDIVLDFTVEATLIDPDGLDRLTDTELSTLAVEDFVSLEFPADPPDDLNVSLSLTADVFGTMFGGNLSITDDDLFAGDVAEVEVTQDGSNPIDLMSNIGSDLAITSLAQLVSGFGVGMIAGDIDLPFLADGVFIPGDLGQAEAADFDQVFDVIKPLMDYIAPRSAGQIVCGTTAIDPDGEGTGVDGIPAGSIRNLDGTETVQCRAYTSSDGSNVTWTITSGNAVFISGENDAGSVGVEPTLNVRINPESAAGELKVEVEYTPEGETDPVTIVQRPDTIQQLLTELAGAGLIPMTGGGDPVFAYDADIEAFTFPISTTIAGISERDASINAGNTLVAKTGITGLSGDASADAHVTLGQVNAAVTLGLIVTDDVATINPDDNGDDELAPGPGDRFFLAGSDPLLAVTDVDIGGNFAMNGRLGFLEVGATATGSLTSPGAGDALSVSLNYPAGGVESNGNTLSNAILIRDLLRSDVADTISASIDLVYNGSVAVNATAPGIGASGSFNVNWDLNNAAPTIDGFSDSFNQTLIPFTSDLQLTQFGAPDATDPTLLTIDGTGPVDLLSEPGLVGSQLVDDADNVCNITAVLSSTQLTCSNADPATDQLNPISFMDGTSYDVKGNTLAKLSEILAALDGLVQYLEEVIGAADFNEPIPLIGITPADLVSQVGELRRMIDEFRGIQDAAISCAVQGDPSIDIRAIPVSADDNDDGTIDLECFALASTAGASDVKWRISSPDADDPGPFVSGGDDSVAPSGSTAAFAVELPVSFDTKPEPTTDGYISLGSEYTVEVKWSDSTGDHQAAFPPRVPQSLDQLNELIVDVLGIPENVLTFQLLDVATDPTLRINLGYGICSDPAPDFDGGTDPCANRPTAPAPEASLNLDLGSDLPFAGLSIDGQLPVRFAVLGQFDVGIPLTGGDAVLYGTTGIDARVQVTASDDFGVQASIGPVNVSLGTAANGGTGEVETDDPNTLNDMGVFGDAAVGMLVTNTDTGAQCIISALIDADSVTCGEGWSDDEDFAVGDPFIIGGANDLEGALQISVELTDGGASTEDSDAVPFDDAGVSITSLDEFLMGAASCGRIDEDHMLRVIGSAFDAAERDLGGIACAQLSASAEIGGSSVYLGEIDVEIDATMNPFRVWIPSDLGTRLEQALLDPAFLLRAFPDLLEFIENGMRDAADAGIPSAIGDPLRTGADGIEILRGEIEAFIDPLATALEGKTPGGNLEGEMATQLASLLGIDAGDIDVVAMCGGAECTNANTLLQITDVSATFNFGKMVEASSGVNLGLEGLPLSVEAGVMAFADWDLSIGIGVSRDNGPYVQLDSGAEFSAGAGVTLDNGAPNCDDPMTDEDVAGLPTYTTDRCIRARLGFLQVEALDNNDTRSVIAARLGLDVKSEGADEDVLTLGDILAGDVSVTPVLAAEVNLDVHIRTGIEGATADLPTVLGTFVLNWSIGDFGADPDDPSDDNLVPFAGIEIPAPTVEFANLHLDLGSILSGFIAPIANEIKKITGPIQPIIDVITAPIPVVSDLAELVGGDPITMISILEAATGADLSLVEAVAAFITFFNEVPTEDDVLIPLGNIPGGGTERTPGAFKVDADAAATKLSPSEAGSLIKQGAGSGYEGGKGFTNDVGSADGGKLNNLSSPDPDRPSTFGVPGLSFPFLEDASQVFGLLVGRDAVLIRWDAGTLRATAGMSYDFGPIMVGPIPITITIGGEIGIEGRFAIGYDTSGIRKLLDGGSGVALFDGIFIDDLDAQGNDVPEIKFFGRVFAGASVDLVIVSAGVRGGIELTFALDLDDRPDADGKLRIEEIVDKLANPICLFVVSGKIEAFLEAFVEIDLFFFSKEFSFELVRITLLEWSSACEPPEPRISDDDDGDDTVDSPVLYLNIGERRDRRNIKEEVTDEVIEVRQIGDNKVRVSAYGWEEVRTGVELIVADGGYGDDEILFLPGSEEGADATKDPVTGDLPDVDVPFTIPVAVSGGFGNDIIKTGDSLDGDLIYGDAQLPNEWADISFTPPAVETGTGDDSDKNFEGKDTINAGKGDDVVKADGGDDRVEGEEGDDTIEGGDGNDQLNGGPGGDAVLGQSDDDAVHGGPIEQPDEGATDAQINDDDALSGGPGLDVVSGDFGSDVMFGDDPVSGFMDPDSDMRRSFTKPSAADWRGWCELNLSGDADIMAGHDGNDFMVGGGGDDKMDAGAGNDFACGNGGEDEILGDVGDDELRGNGDDDVIKGDDGHDVIYGGAGNDLANGNDGNDDIFGDEDADLLFGDDGDDIVVGDTGSVASHNTTTDHGVDGTSIDEARVVAMNIRVTRDSSTSEPQLADCDVDGGLTGGGDSDCIFGGNGSDALFGGSDGDIIQGQAGSDLIEGNHGPDELRGGNEQDLIFGNEDGDNMFGDGGDDLMFGDRDIPAWVANDPTGSAVDNMNGGPGADHMEGDGGNDVMFGGADSDHMEGNNGDDTMFGESGNDNMIGGSDNNEAEPDTGETLMSGGLGNDVMTGDNAAITDTGYVGGRSVTLHDPTIGGPDIMEGDAATDYMFGQVGNDTMYGDQGNAAPFLGTGDADYMEGNDGDDSMYGEIGNDDMIGGSSATNGAIIAGRIGTDASDSGETLISGGPGNDWIAGDNARMDRVLAGLSLGDPANPLVLFDLAGTDKPAVLAAAHGGDTLQGDEGTDLMFGQGSNDTMSGGDDPDYMEGNDGNDAMSGDDGDDDMVGGGSAYDGIIDEVRVGEKLWDEGETVMSGGDGVDWMAGDNAFMNRVLFPASTLPLDLFDVNSSDDNVSGGDIMNGDAGEDLMFGQGNGAQVDQSDPADGMVDNDGDGDEDEDGPGWLGDVMFGGADDDYMEGNHGSDLMYGEGGDDDIIGGGSAFNGLYVPNRIGDDLNDERDTIYGGEGQDVIAGDNARINRGDDAQALTTGLILSGGTDREVLLFDVDSATAAFSGGDYLSGGADRDLMFGQGNGSQDPDQADPLDGVDNDLDGREDGDPNDPDDLGYDCSDFGFENGDGDNLADGDDPECIAAIDEDQPWDGDIMLGNGGDDYMEGNHGSDWMFGNADEDDMIGGGSAANGAIVPLRDPVGLTDGHDVMSGGGEDDVMTGDNARINRVEVSGAWDRITNAGLAIEAGFGDYDQAVRITDMGDTDAGGDTHGDDYIEGNDGNDEMYGQLGDDFAIGGLGDDALVGDLGQVTANVIGDDDGDDPTPTDISTNSPHWDDRIYELGSMWWETVLYAFDTSQGGVGGDDILLGHDGRDTVFGGPGNDIINGDGDGTDEFLDTENPEFSHIMDIDPSTFDRDMLFGGDNDDVLWGGRDNDVLMGGYGADYLDVRPRDAGDNGRKGGQFQEFDRDLPEWHAFGFPENFQDVDFIYGGWDQDAMQADQAANGPDPGDRLADWAGGFNVFYICPAGYGDYSITRQGSPHSLQFLRDLAEASGAIGASSEGTSGFRDLAYVFTNQRGQNSHPPHPDHAAHFTCADLSDAE